MYMFHASVLKKVTDVEDDAEDAFSLLFGKPARFGAAISRPSYFLLFHCETGYPGGPAGSARGNIRRLARETDQQTGRRIESRGKRKRELERELTESHDGPALLLA